MQICLKLIAKESVKSHHCGPNHGLSMVSKELAHVLEDLKFASGYAQKLKEKIMYVWRISWG
jgi:hypothetical protein